MPRYVTIINPETLRFIQSILETTNRIEFDTDSSTDLIAFSTKIEEKYMVEVIDTYIPFETMHDHPEFEYITLTHFENCGFRVFNFFERNVICPFTEGFRVFNIPCLECYYMLVNIRTKFNFITGRKSQVVPYKMKYSEKIFAPGIPHNSAKKALKEIELQIKINNTVKF